MKTSDLKTIIREELINVLVEKAESQSQQIAAAIALAAKRGKIPVSKLKGASKEMYKMSVKELEKYASTKRNKLPYTVNEEETKIFEEVDRSIEILDKIKMLMKLLQKQKSIQENPVAQRLNAKFTGLLGKMTSYINQQKNNQEQKNE